MAAAGPDGLATPAFDEHAKLEAALHQACLFFSMLEVDCFHSRAAKRTRKGCRSVLIFLLAHIYYIKAEVAVGQVKHKVVSLETQITQAAIRYSRLDADSKQAVRPESQRRHVVLP